MTIQAANHDIDRMVDPTRSLHALSEVVQILSPSRDPGSNINADKYLKSKLSDPDRVSKTPRLLSLEHFS